MGDSTPDQFMRKVESSRSRIFHKDISELEEKSELSRLIQSLKEKIKRYENPRFFRGGKQEKKRINSEAGSYDLRKFF